jgi:ATP-dependent Lon protease
MPQKLNPALKGQIHFLVGLRRGQDLGGISSRALGKKYTLVSLGGVRDEAHPPTQDLYRRHAGADYQRLRQ